VTTNRDDMQARAAALLALYNYDPRLKVSRYEVLTDDLLARLDEAVNYLRRVVQADRDDTKMGYPIPGDSCLAACIGLEVMRFLDDVGALTDGVGTDGKRTVGVMAGSNEAASLPEAGRSPTPSVSAPDIDALANTARRGFVVGKAFNFESSPENRAFSDLVAFAKEAEARVAALNAALAEGIEAFRLTREYVGESLLPRIEGWSWFDWCEKAAALIEGSP